MRDFFNNGKYYFLAAAIICLAIYYGKMMRVPLKTAERLTIYVDYHGLENFEPLNTLISASDPNFEHELSLVSRRFAPDEGIYAFIYEIETIPDTVYISKPCVYVLMEEGPIELSLKSSSERAKLNGQDWFQISNVTSETFAAGVFDIAVSIRAVQSALPANASLEIGEVKLDEIKGGSESGIEFDEDENYVAETFCFRYNQGAREDIADLLSESALIVDDIYLKVCDVDIGVSSDVESVELIVASRTSDAPVR